MNLDQFVSNVLATNNGYVDVDKAYGPQCWDLVELYAEQVLNVPKEPWAITLGPNKSAYEAWTVFDSHMQKYFTKISSGQQQKGDINVYSGKPGFPEGHICIDMGGGLVFQQNASVVGSPSHLEGRATSYLLGSLRLKGGAMSNPIDVLRIIAGEVQGFDPTVYSGKYDTNLTAEWGEKPLEQVVREAYSRSTKHRYQLQAELDASGGDFEPVAGQAFKKKGQVL